MDTPTRRFLMFGRSWRKRTGGARRSGGNRGRRMRDVSGVTEAFADCDGVRLWTVSQSVGHPVMLCNGGAGCCDYLDPVAVMFDDLCRVIRFEQRGCGRSQLVPPYNIETCLID